MRGDHLNFHRTDFFGLDDSIDSLIRMVNEAIIDPAGQERYRQQFHKTSFCKYFLANACRKGDQCSHAHSPDELQTKPVLSKTRMCKQMLRIGNCNDPDCGYAHAIEELTAANAFFRTKMCEFNSTAGGCILGDKCRYAHSESELLEGSKGSSANLQVSSKSVPQVDYNDSPDTGYPLKKRGSMSSHATMASYASMSTLSQYQVVAPAPVVFVYPNVAFAPYYAVYED